MAQLTRKSYQRKAAATGFAIFLTGSLAATGFAAWAIASSAKEEVHGDVNVFTVTDKSISIIVDPFTPENEGIIRFEPTKEDEFGRVRNDGVNFECLGFTVAGSIAPFEYVSDFTIRLDLGTIITDPETGEEKVVVDEEAEERFEKAASVIEGEETGNRGSYITLPECWRNPIDVEDVNERRDPVRFSHHIEFGWGTAFDGINPGDYFDLKDEEGETYLISDDDMRDTLYDFYTLMTGMPSEGVSELDKERGYTNLKYVITLFADTSGSHEEYMSEDSVEGSEDASSEEVSQ